MTQYIQLTFEFQKEGRKWVGYCRELGTSAYGKTMEEAESSLKSAIICHVNTLEELGEAARFFEENDITVLTERPSKSHPHMRPVDITMPAETDKLFKPHVQRIPILAGR
ncbi:hypothetical protein DEALK_09740 [Dehalogenimonas alkenigignens]|uniref:Uncharacterized protein n=1 Tax=Dehalogenimonas alkenigignens TaxID=1217799 RepID=A0A0W0GHU6_9CHLR|nr:hypothetical protein [Dehalogenimonas alkenigignens]KTB48129.1 hypothetical protein DEALK_09740 [Dehalogenimonas alkenigignens]